MSTTFHSVQVKNIRKTTSECAVITLDIPEPLQDTFHYKQGQYLTFKALIDKEEVRRSYSLCSSPTENTWQVAVKKIEDGRFSTYANDVLEEGDLVEVMAPLGKFYTEIDPSSDKQYAAFAAGSGITPILSIIKTHLEMEPDSSFSLFYVNRSVSSIILREEIEGLKNKYFERFQVFHFLTQEDRATPMFNGRINTEKLDFITDHLLKVDQIDDLFICGPNDMIFMIQDYFEQKGLAKKSIHFELFNTPTSVAKGRKTKVKPKAGFQSEIRIKEGGIYQTIRVDRSDQSILDAVLDHNMDIPYACKGGVCCTCRAKLISGKVDQQVSYGLEPEEIEDGYILTCTALPLSKEIEVDYDL